jgi:hypothetical protein
MNKIRQFLSGPFFFLLVVILVTLGLLYLATHPVIFFVLALLFIMYLMISRNIARSKSQ